MHLVDYSSSSDDEAAPQPHQPPQVPTGGASLKRKRPSDASAVSDDGPRAQPGDLPPLPSSFHDLYASTARASTHDDPSLHGGRKRGVPHVEGLWPSHVYLEWYPSPAETNKLGRLIDAVGAQLSLNDPGVKLHSLLQTDLSTPRPLHVSLSQPLSLETDQRQPFADSLASSIRRPGVARGSRTPKAVGKQAGPREPQGRRIAAFSASFTDLGWAANDTRTRWFLILRIERPQGDELNRLLSVCNRVSRGFGLGELYANKGKEGEKRQNAGRQDSDLRNRKARFEEDGSSAPPADFTDRFHFSIAWTLEEPSGIVSTEQLKVLERDNASFATAVEDLRGIEVRFDAVKLKIGNEITTIQLSDTVEDSQRGILG